MWQPQMYIIVFQALETAEMYDRVHLRTTYYNYARHLESKGDVNGAIPKYVPYHLLVLPIDLCEVSCVK